jgi:hypothetical protein
MRTRHIASVAAALLAPVLPAQPAHAAVTLATCDQTAHAVTTAWDTSSRCGAYPSTNGSNWRVRSQISGYPGLTGSLDAYICVTPTMSNSDCALLERAAFADGVKVADVHLPDAAVSANHSYIFITQATLFEERLWCTSLTLCLDRRVGVSTVTGHFRAVLSGDLT